MSIDKVILICEKRIAELNLPQQYRERMVEESKDLQSWENIGVKKSSKLLDIRDSSTVADTNRSGSVILFLLGITSVDPIKEGIEIKRELIQCDSPPDIDTDFDPAIRDVVKEKVVNTFGKTKVCSIGTYQTYKTRAVIVEVARALGLDSKEAMEITKELEPLKAMEDDEGEECIVDKMDFDSICNHYPALKTYLGKNPEVLRHSLVLRNQIRNTGRHAGGLIISDLELKDKIPVFTTSDGDIVSSWSESGNASELSAVGLIKYDILGLKNLTVVSDCVKYIKQNRGISLSKKDMPVDDREAIKIQAKSDLVGIFQFENPATREIVDAVGMDSLNDISAITSLLRPGPKDMGMHMEYADRKNGRKEFKIKECLKNILGETFGVLTYQEQAMRISRSLAGFSGPEANKLRKVIGKKKPDDMKKMHDKFVKGSQPRIDSGEFTSEEVEEMWKLIESFAGYAFNASHAFAYSSLTANELWLKHTYFLEYMTALLNNTKIGDKKHGSDNLMGDYINYCRSKGLVVLPPDVNNSKMEFTIENGFIRYSLSHVKNVSSAAEIIVKHQPYSSIEDFVERCFDMKPAPGNKLRKHAPTSRVVETLILAGAFKSFGSPKEVLSRYGSLRKKKDESDIISMTEPQLKAKERELLGSVLSEPPIINKYYDEIEKNKWHTIGNEAMRKNINVFCQIDEVSDCESKSGKKMLRVTASDGIYTIKFFVWSADILHFKRYYSVGTVGVVSLSRFEDIIEGTGNSAPTKKLGPRFFNGKETPIVLEEHK